MASTTPATAQGDPTFWDGSALVDADDVQAWDGSALKRGLMYAWSGSALKLLWPETMPAVTGLAAAEGTDKQHEINLSWDALAAKWVYESFVVEKATAGAGGPFSAITESPVARGVFAVTAAGLADNTEYWFRVYAFLDGTLSEDWRGAYSAVVSRTTVIAAPSSAAEFATGFPKDNVADDDGLLISIDAVPTATQYDVYSKVGATMAGDPVANGALVDGGAIAAASIEAVAEYLHATGQAHGVVVYYQARARNAGGAGPFGAEKSATVAVRVPGVPTIGTVTESGGTATIPWTPVAPLTQNTFRIQVASRACGGSFGAWGDASPATDTTSPATHAVLDGNQYKFRVRAEGDGGDSAYSSESNTITVSEAPNAPVMNTPSAGSPIWSAVDLTWSKATTGVSDDVEIHRSLTSGSGFSLVHTQASSDEDWTDSVADDDEYFYKCREINDCGDTGPFSNEVSIVVPVAPPAIAPAWSSTFPKDDSTDDDSIVGDYDLPPDAVTVQVYFKVGANFGTPSDPTLDGTELQDSATLNFDHSGHSHGDQIWYALRGRNGTGDGPWSTPVSATVAAEVPGVPTIGTVTETALTATIPWTPNAPLNATAFRTQVASRVCGGAFGGWSDVGTEAASPETHPVLNGNQYKYRVRAEGVGGDSVYSSESNTITVADAPGIPTAPAAVLGTPSISVIDVSWTPAGTGTVDDVEIHMSTTSAGAGFSLLATQVYTDGTYSATGLADNVQHWFKMREVNDCGDDGTFSAVVTATTDLAAPDTAPANITLVPKQGTDHQVTVDYDDVPDGTTYEIYLSLSTMGADPTVGGTHFTPDPSDANPIDIDVASLLSATPDDQVFVNVRAVNSGGNGPWGTEASGYTHVETPQSFAATQDAGECPGVVFDLAWDDDNSASDQRNEARVIQRDDGSGYATIHTTAAGDKSYRDTGAVAGTVGYRMRYSSETTYATDTVTVDCPE